MSINSSSSGVDVNDPDELIYVVDDQQTLIDPPTERRSRWQKIRRALSKVSIEPVMCLYIIGVKLPEIPVENLLIYKVCRQQHFNTTVCDNLLNDNEYFFDKVIVQQNLADWKIYIELMLAVPMLFLSIVVGPWSDKFGRKVPLLVPILGRIACILCIIVNVYYKDTPVLYLILSFLPSAFLGSNVVSIISCSYISDITKKSSRTTRLAVMTFLMYLGEPVALVAGSKIFDHFGFYPLLIASVCCLVLSLIFGMVFVEETIRNTEPISTKIKCFFSVGIVKEFFTTLTRQRPDKKRKYLWFYIAAYVVYILYRVADWKVTYMFTQVLFDWEIDDFTTFSAIRMSFGLVVLIAIAPFLSKVYRVKDHTFVIVGILTSVICYLIFGMCHSVRLFYLGAIIGSLMGLVTLGIMSAVSKLVTENEQGTLFAALVAIEVFVPVIGSVIQLQVYKHTINFFAGFVYLMNSAFLILPLGMVLWMKKETQRKMVEISTQTEIAYC